MEGWKDGTKWRPTAFTVLILHFCCHRLRKVNGCAQNSWNKKSAHRTVSNAGLGGHKPEILRCDFLQLTHIKTRWLLQHCCQGCSSNEAKRFWRQHSRQTSGLCHYGYLDTEPPRLCANTVAKYIGTVHTQGTTINTTQRTWYFVTL